MRTCVESDRSSKRMLSEIIPQANWVCCQIAFGACIAKFGGKDSQGPTRARQQQKNESSIRNAWLSPHTKL